MQDVMNRNMTDSGKKVFAIVMKGSKISADILAKTMKMAINEYKKNHHSEMSLNKLLAKGDGASSVELGNEDVATFRKVARKYNIDYAIKVDNTTDPPTHLAFFKAKETDVITQAFKEFIVENEKKRDKVPFKQKLQEKKNIISKQPKTLEKTKEKVRGKER